MRKHHKLRVGQMFMAASCVKTEPVRDCHFVRSIYLKVIQQKRKEVIIKIRSVLFIASRPFYVTALFFYF